MTPELDQELPEGVDDNDINDATFGDCAVGDDWQPDQGQEAFQRELEEARGSPISAGPPPGLSKARPQGMTGPGPGPVSGMRPSGHFPAPPFAGLPPPGSGMFGQLGRPPVIPPGVDPRFLRPPFGHPGLPRPGYTVPPSLPGFPPIPGMAPHGHPHGPPWLPGMPPMRPHGGLPGPPAMFPPGWPGARAPAPAPPAEPKVMSLAEVETQMLAAAGQVRPVSPPGASSIQSGGATRAMLPEVPGGADATQLSLAELVNPEDDEPEVETPGGFIAPFTDAARQKIVSAKHDDPIVRQFTRAAKQQKPHVGFMASGDKELIVRIQLNQMAAIGELASQSHRNTFTHRNEEKSPTSREKEAIRLVSRLRESIGAGRGHSSVHGPRTSIDISPSDAPEAEPTSVVPPVDLPPGLPIPPPVKTPKADSQPEKPAEKRARWRWQLGVEKAYEELLELERLTFRISECHPMDSEKLTNLRTERSGVLERLSKQLGGGTGDVKMEEATLARLAGSRKGRALLQRILTCLLPQNEPGLAASVVPLLWRLMVGLLRGGALGRMLILDEQPGVSSTFKDQSRKKLLWALTRSVEAARNACEGNFALELSLHGVGLLDSLAASGNVEALCSRVSGSLLFRALVDGAREGLPEVAEVIPEPLIDALCKALPNLYSTAVVERPDGQEAEVISQEDLWATLISLAEQCTDSQKLRVNGLIGSFVTAVNAGS
mmetsp:Transcript_9357/g.16572  ORF Transcript_9357/g.16572 Transcript_9357/m.16572 type:complete len:716 (+) Transcript_9357:85-2232(+)